MIRVGTWKDDSAFGGDDGKEGIELSTGTGETNRSPTPRMLQSGVFGTVYRGEELPDA